MDNTNTDYLLIGNIDGTIARYANFVNNLGTFQRIDSNYSEIQVLNRSVPAIADLDGDGDYEMVIGNKLGGLNYFKQVKNVLQGASDVQLSANSVELYPNPASQQIHILLKADIKDYPIHVRLLDLTGKEVLRQRLDSSNGLSIPISSLAPGMYLAEIVFGKNKITRKIIKTDK